MLFPNNNYKLFLFCLGKASMISQSWFQIAQPDKRKSPTKHNESFGAATNFYKSLNSAHSSPSTNKEVIAMRDLNKSESSPTSYNLNATSNSDASSSSNSKFYLNESVSNGDAKLANDKQDQFLSSSQFNEVL